jgi:hypothetical protein
MAITVVNMIPKALSGETNQDSEPNLAVNPANPLQIVGTAFTPNPSGGTLAPIFVSSDGGHTWALNPIVPGATTGANAFPTADITAKFGGTSNILYAGILRADTLALNILRTSNYTSSTPMTLLESRGNEDQPWVQATTTGGVDRVYIGNNDFNTSPNTGTVDQSLNAGTAPAPAGFGPITLEKTSPGGGQDGPSIRATIHSSGRIYIAHISWTASVGSLKTSNIVVQRDDNWGQGSTPYTALGTGGKGVNVVTGTKIPWQNNPFLGQERVGSHLSIAVDPNNSSIVYIAWADFPNGVAPYTIHLRKSTDGGVTWSADLRAIANGVNPAIAINSSSHVGFLYQTLTTSGTKWETHFELSTNGFATAPAPSVLATVPSNAPAHTFLPYMGDYIYLTAVGTTFYGVFCANNTPNNANFPNGVTFQRNANFTTHTLLNVDNKTPVAISIDPFFFSVTELTIPITPITPIKVISPILTIKPITPIHVIAPIETIAPIQHIGPITTVDPINPVENIPPVKPKE